MNKPQALKLVRDYNRKRAPDSNVRAILTYDIENRYVATLVETETAAIVGTVEPTKKGVEQ